MSWAPVVIVVVATIYAIRQTAGLGQLIGGGVGERRRRRMMLRALRAGQWWEVSVMVAMLALGSAVSQALALLAPILMMQMARWTIENRQLFA